MKYFSLKRYTWLLCSICYAVTLQAYGKNKQELTNEQLQDIKQAINSEKQQIVKISKSQKQLEQQLEQDELAIAKNIKQLKNTKNEITTNQQILNKLNQQQKSLIQQKKQQEFLLAKQLQTAYTSGDYDYLKLLLNQEKASEVQRTLSYYQYLNKARINEINAFQTTIANLLEVVTQQQEKTKKLNELKEQQLISQQKLNNNKKQRKSTIVQLNSKLLTRKQKLAKLEAEENNLQVQLNKLVKESQKSLEFLGLAKLHKKLKWPVKGKLARSFGSSKQGYLRWKGVLINAPLGKTVNSIYGGKVIFADWLKGYGLVTVIDHGKGYMSLYGHNQALLKSVGETIEAGEPIALVGQSGGQSNAALYFEIRYKGKALNPKKWCR